MIYIYIFYVYILSPNRSDVDLFQDWASPNQGVFTGANQECRHLEDTLHPSLGSSQVWKMFI